MAKRGERPFAQSRNAIDEIETVVARSRRLAGCLAADVVAGVDVASWINISRFVEATGDENPLYTDVRYGARSSHHTMLAPPTFALAVRMPDSVGALDEAPHRLIDMMMSLQLVWDDTIKLADKLQGRVWLTEARSVRDSKGLASARIASVVEFERNGIEFARGCGVVGIFPQGSKSKPLVDRTIYSYSEAEIVNIIECLERESAPRGDIPRFWSDTAVGDQLPVLLKGPLTFSDLLVWKFSESRPIKAGNLRHHDLAQYPGRQSVNPITGWPAWDRREVWEDSAVSSSAGLPAPAAHGGLLFALAGQLVSHWMGDDSFLRRLSSRIRQPLLYGDTLTLSGAVADRYKLADEAGNKYHAALVEISGTNQLQESVVAAEAIVFLPEKGMPIQLPVHGGLTFIDSDVDHAKFS